MGQIWEPRFKAVLLTWKFKSNGFPQTRRLGMDGSDQIRRSQANKMPSTEEDMSQSDLEEPKTTSERAFWWFSKKKLTKERYLVNHISFR